MHGIPYFKLGRVEPARPDQVRDFRYAYGVGNLSREVHGVVLQDLHVVEEVFYLLEQPSVLSAFYETIEWLQLFPAK